MEIELKNCPFCDNEPVYRYLLQKNSREPDGFDTWGVGCGYTSCPATPFTGYEYTKRAAAILWNTRAIDTVLERLEALENENALERQFICKKCGLRQELGVKAEPNF